MENWYDIEAQQALAHMQVDPQIGLAEQNIPAKQAEHGQNTFAAPKKTSL